MSEQRLDLPREVKHEASLAQRVLDAAKGIRVVSRGDYVEAGEVIKEIKRRRRALDEARRAATRPIEEAKRAIVLFFAEPMRFLERAEETVEAAMLSWDKEQRRRAEEARLRQEAVAREAREAAIVALEEARVARTTGESRGEFDVEDAEDRLAQAEAPVVAAPVSPPRIEGVVKRRYWKFRVVDASLVPREFLTVDAVKLGEFARFAKDEARLPGVEFYCEEGIAG